MAQIGYNNQPMKEERPPVIVVVGHIDHGKSKLLDYIRKSNVVAKEAGGITQHISAYEAGVTLKDGRKKQITFLDTPGHASFSQMRTRGCNIADIAILVVSAEEGVKTQTLEALKSIKECKTPFIVAINKVDKPEANIESTKNSLLEKEVYLEGLGGDIPYVPVSAETGEGVQELLETIVLMAELEELKGNESTLGKGFVIEANMDPKRGISASLVLKSGHLKSGMHVVSGQSGAPIRIMENFLGEQIKEARPSSPIRITGWDSLPEIGAKFEAYKNKKDVVLLKKPSVPTAVGGNSTQFDKSVDKSDVSNLELEEDKESTLMLPITIKGDTQGSVEAIVSEIEKIKEDKVEIKIIESKTGNITESDVKKAGSSDNSIIIGFNVKTDRGIDVLAQRLNVQIETFDIIYKLTEWIQKEVLRLKPKFKKEEVRGKARILKIFSKSKDKQVIGGEVFEGNIGKGDKIKILRRGEEIGSGNILELQSAKTAVNSINEGNQFGAKIVSSIEMSERDNLESITIVEK
jgi:translation initiation factor IF-2